MSRCNSTIMQANGRVTIPTEIRRHLVLSTGDPLTFVETEQGLLVRPQEVLAMESLDSIGKELAEKGISLDDLLEAGLEIRPSLAKELYPTITARLESSLLGRQRCLQPFLRTVVDANWAISHNNNRDCDTKSTESRFGLVADGQIP